MLEIIHDTIIRGRIRHALFDFDGTLSLIREGWQGVMIPLMVELLSETPAHESEAELHAVVAEFVTRLTGKQTIYQMIQLADEIAQLLLNDRLADILVGDFEIRQKVIVEEVAKGAVADVVQEPGDSHVLFDKSRRGTVVSQNPPERGIEMLGKLPGKVHRAQGMLEPAVLRRGINPAGALQLINIAKPLNPGGIDDIFLRDFPFFLRHRKLDIAVNGIGH